MSLATDRSVVCRALKMAAVVGTILIAINHGDALWKGDLSAGRAARMALTYCVPYLVSTVSSVGVMRELRQRSAKSDGQR